MNAFRFLSLLTVGFSLLVFVFLLNATQGRAESEARRVLKGPELALTSGEVAEWALNLGGSRIDEAWPAPQRQPRLYLAGASEGALGDAQVVVVAHYVDTTGKSRPAFLDGPESVGVAGEVPGELSFGPLWMNWDDDLKLEARVQNAAGGGSAHLVLRGEASLDYIAARSMARTLWFVFTAIAAAGFAGLMLTVRDSAAGSD